MSSSQCQDASSPVGARACAGGHPCSVCAAVMLPSRRHRFPRTSFQFGALLISEDPDDALLLLAARSSLSPDVRDFDTPSPGSGDEPGSGDGSSRHRAAGARGHPTSRARWSREAGLSSDGGGGGEAQGMDGEDDSGGEGGRGDGGGEMNRQGLDGNDFGVAGGRGLDGDGGGGGNGQGVNPDSSAARGAQGLNSEGCAGGDVKRSGRRRLGRR